MVTVLTGAQVSPSGYPGPGNSDAFPIGAVVDYCGAAEPAGWIFCYGQALNRVGIYADLFAVIGTTYGGSGSTFNLPDARGFVFAGRDNMGGTAASRLTTAWGVDGATLGANGGAQSHALVISQMPAHDHQYVQFGAAGNVAWAGGSGAYGSGTTTGTGGNAAHPNVQPTLIVNKIIKYAQVSLSPPTPGTGDVVGPNVSVDGQIAVFDGTTGKAIRSGGTGIRLPRNYLSGGILSNNVADAVNDLDVSAGVCRDDTDAVDITIPVITKRLDAAWTAGTNQGGRDGTLADGSWHVYVIMKADKTTDVIMTSNYDNPTMPSGYLYKRRLGSIIRSGAGGFRDFKQYGDYFQLFNPVDTHSGASLNQSGTFFGALSASVPQGKKWLVDLIVQHGCTAANAFSWISDPDAGTGTTGRPSFYTQVAGGSTVWRGPIWCNASSQVRITTGTVVGTYNYTLSPVGWWDPRRKDQ